LNENQELMALDEGYAGEKLVKLPGGGLEFGEGTLECLHREFAEELNLKIEVLEHFYTQEDFWFLDLEKMSNYLPFITP
jgi:8-oxo-dGTP pyrophosphatase MutT (NUDIX family)